MKKQLHKLLRYFSFLSLLLINSSAYSSEKPDTTQLAEAGDLHIMLNKIPENAAGFIVSVYRDRDSFLKNADQVFYYTPEQLVDQVIILEQLAYGDIAISVSADMNDNRQLDTKVFGIPAEPVGFVNNPKARFGPPKFESSVFRHDRHPHHAPLTFRSL